jgi:hypothetical protein
VLKSDRWPNRVGESEAFPSWRILGADRLIDADLSLGLNPVSDEIIALS